MTGQLDFENEGAGSDSPPLQSPRRSPSPEHPIPVVDEKEKPRLYYNTVLVPHYRALNQKNLIPDFVIKEIEQLEKQAEQLVSVGNRNKLTLIFKAFLDFNVNTASQADILKALTDEDSALYKAFYHKRVRLPFSSPVKKLRYSRSSSSSNQNQEEAIQPGTGSASLRNTPGGEKPVTPEQQSEGDKAHFESETTTTTATSETESDAHESLGGEEAKARSGATTLIEATSDNEKLAPETNPEVTALKKALKAEIERLKKSWSWHTGVKREKLEKAIKNKKDDQLIGDWNNKNSDLYKAANFYRFFNAIEREFWRCSGKKREVTGTVHKIQEAIDAAGGSSPIRR